MTHRSDDKASALATLTGSTGHVDDLEMEWLLSVVTVPVSAQVNDLWMELFIQQGGTFTEFNDSANEFLGDLGYTGALPDRWAQYWAAGGGGITPAYDPGMMTFDGSSGYYNDTYTSAGNKVTFVGRFNVADFAGGSSQVICKAIGSVAAARGQIFLIANDHAITTRRGKLLFLVTSTALATVCLAISSSVFIDGADHTYLISYDGDAGTATMRVDGADELDTGNPENTLTTGTLSTGASTLHVGATQVPGNYLAGDIGYFGMRDIYLTNYSDFMSGSTPLELDETTWTEWGAQPLYWQDEGTMTANLGSAGNMTSNGTITGPA